MAHSNAYPYPLPFPNGDQVIQISSYSSLANALGTDPEHASRQGRRPAIYSEGPPVSNPSYPYPARNVMNPGTYPARTPLSVANGRYSSNASIVQGENNEQRGGLTRYDGLPQQFFAESRQSGPEFPTIHFQRKESDLVDGDSPIFVESSGHMIKIKLNWPGYLRYPCEKRVTIKRDVPLTRSLLLMELANHVEGIAKCIQKEHNIAKPDQGQWAVTTWKDCVITRLQHQMGSTWQLEIYHLRG